MHSDTYISRNNGTICIRHKKLVETVIKDERGTVFSSTEGLIKGIQKIEERTGLLVADPLVSVNQGKNCLYLLNMLSEAINKYYDKNVVHYTNLRNQSQLNGLFNSKEQHATLNDAQLSSKEIKKVQIMFDKHNRFFSRSSTDLVFWDKIRHKMKLSADAKPFQRSKGSINFEKRKAMKKIMEDLERGNLVELLTRIEQPHPYLIKNESRRVVIDYR